MHKRPSSDEIEHCKWWLDRELGLVKPATVVALGVTAARSLLGRTVTIARTRGRPQALDDRTPVSVAIHPSLLMRLRDETEKDREYRRFVADLQAAAATPGRAR